MTAPSRSAHRGRLEAVQALLELHSQRRARSVLDGGYASVFRGRGTDFEDLREYVPGDAVADIDWKATARAGKPLVRRYRVERKNNLGLVVSTGRSMTAVAPDGTPKHELALDVAGVFAGLAVRHRDVVGAVFGDAHRQQAVRTRAGRAHAEYVLDRLAAESGDHSGVVSDLPAVLDHAVKARLPRGIMVLITDDAVLTAAGERSLALLHARHQVMVFRIADMPVGADAATAPFDVETGLELPDEVRLDRAVVAQAEAEAARLAQSIERALAARGIAHGRVTGQAGLVETLIDVLERHRRGGK
ncbi:MAG: DUF58 domain-containing protein [Bifidobacteriaceae bacterium]|jgi:uncharacterized protein (DUF58 family)|nr:DUF58 domain-containing protein [Bifidobacteriaceae bacterium]